MKKLGTLLLFIPLFAFAQTTTISNQYKRAEEYALSLNADSAFKLLFSLAYNYNFKDYEKLSTNEQFETLTSDNRWLKLLTIVERNELNYLKLDQKLILILDTIHKEDQEPRNAIPGIEERYGKESNESLENNRSERLHKLI